MTSPTQPESIQAQRQQLARFSLMTVAPELSEAEVADVQGILAQFNQQSDYQTLGICADTLAAAKTAMEAYLNAHGVTVTLDLPPRDGPVYLKFNTLKGAWYLDDYSGPSRGVLVSYHVSESEADAINGTYGPFPLDLFD